MVIYKTGKKCYNFNMKSLNQTGENFSQSDYQQTLLSLIPNLGRFEKKEGGEGIVFFVDENFIVKQFTLNISGFDAFDKYCKEVNQFANRGYCLPKIYAWAPFESRQTGDIDYFILEEKVKGKELYSDCIIFQAYNLCKDFCSRDEFNMAVNLKSGSLFEKILLTYMGEFIKTNRQLSAIGDAELEKFILSDFNITNEQKYSISDVKSDNIIFDGKKLTIIDLAYEEDPFKYSEEESKIAVLHDIMTLFIENERAYNFINMHAGTISSVLKLKDENMKASASAIGKFVRKTNKLLSPVFTDKWDYITFKKFLHENLHEEDSKNIITEIHKEF